MATKAQLFRTQQQREAHPPKPNKPRRPRRDTPVDTSQPGVSATDRRAGGGNSGSRNISARAGRKGGAKLENSATGKASRKSSRKSAGRIKAASNLERRAIRKASSPQLRAAQAKARTT
jgi:hypothetical protein